MSIHTAAGFGDLCWVTQTITVDAVEHATVAAIEANPGWRLIQAGIGKGGQTTLTYGWPWPGEQEEKAAAAKVAEEEAAERTAGVDKATYEMLKKRFGETGP